MENDDEQPPPQPLENVTVEELMATRLAVSGVRIDGLSRTRRAYLDRLVAPVVSTGGTFAGVIEDVSEAVDRLRRTGVFHGVDAFLDHKSPVAADVVFTVSEKPLYFLHTGTSVRASADRETSVEISGVWRNVTGCADVLRVSAAAGAPGSNLSAMFGNATFDNADKSTGLFYDAPYALGLHTHAKARAERYTRHWPASHFRERTHEACAAVSHEYLGDVELGAAWREVGAIQPEASMLLRDEAGHHWKGFVRHRFAIDRRDDPLVPSSGWRVGTNVEAAGLAGIGDARFRKVEGDAQLHVPVGASGISLSLAARGGLADGSRVPVCDRFFLGGPSCLRGFAFRGVGPRESGTALGGLAYYTLSAFISIPAPPRSALSQFFSARAHAFVQAGDVGDAADVGMVFKGPRRLRDSFNALRDNARISAGVGIAAATNFGRVELNYCHVVAKAPADVESGVIQIGLSQEFL